MKRFYSEIELQDVINRVVMNAEDELKDRRTQLVIESFTYIVVSILFQEYW